MNNDVEKGYVDMELHMSISHGMGRLVSAQRADLWLWPASGKVCVKCQSLTNIVILFCFNLPGEPSCIHGLTGCIECVESLSLLSKNFH